MQEPTEDFAEAEAHSPQPAEGGYFLDVPPIPHMQGDNIVFVDETHYMEYNEFGAPLGEWRWNEDLSMWFFDEIPPMGILPQTGITNLPFMIWLLIGLALAAAAWIPYRMRKARNLH